MWLFARSHLTMQTHEAPMTNKLILTIGVALAAALLASTSPSRAEILSEVESARANARAGGPTSERDAELLGWYGPTSTPGDRRWRSRRDYREDYNDGERSNYRRNRYRY
jgi:hypothetical protein